MVVLDSDRKFHQEKVGLGPNDTIMCQQLHTHTQTHAHGSQTDTDWFCAPLSLSNLADQTDKHRGVSFFSHHTEAMQRAQLIRRVCLR